MHTWARRLIRGSGKHSVRRRGGLSIAALVATAWMLIIPRPCWAEVTAQLTASSAKVEAGQPLRVELNVSSDEGAPESPRLTVPNGFGLRGPSISTRFSTSINGWSAQTRREVGATWEVTAPKVGVYKLGPAQAFVKGKAVASNAVTVEVVAPGTLPTQPQPNVRRRPRSLFDDDDFFSGFPGLGRSPLDDLLQQRADLFPDAPPEFHQATAKDPTAFLVATVSPERAVVGQQVTLRVVAYGAAGRFRESDSREPRRADFFSVPLTENSEKQQMYNVQIGETNYLAVKVREYALFPIQAGKLEVGPMKMAFYGSNYVEPRTGRPLERESEPIYLEVTEPPVKGRPLDYQVGDVGRFELEATVSPTKVREGDSFSVVAVLQGEGRLPESLKVPEQTGLEWLEPTVTEQHQVNARRRVEGKRTFTYVVKATRPGSIALGSLSFPYFDAQKRQYARASAALGQVVVEPSAPSQVTGTQPAADNHAASEIKLSELAAAREELLPFAPIPHWSNAPWVLPTMFGLPLGVLITQFARGRVLNFVRRRRAQRSALSERAQDELERAKQFIAERENDGAVAALERAIFLGIEAATGVKARAVLRESLTGTLTHAGLDVTASRAVVNLLHDLEAWRFARQGDIEEVMARTRQVVGSLLHRARSRPINSETQPS